MPRVSGMRSVRPESKSVRRRRTCRRNLFMSNNCRFPGSGALARPEAEPAAELPEQALLRLAQDGELLGDGAGVVGEDAPDDTLALGQQHDAHEAAIFRGALAAHEPAPLEVVH